MPTCCLPRNNKSVAKSVVLIDGEHYPPVVEEALSEISEAYSIQSLVFLGGTEKIGTRVPDQMFGYKLITNKDKFEGLRTALHEGSIETVIDLSDEPVIGYAERLLLANIALAHGAEYKGADFVFSPPGMPKIANKPTLSIIGTGKRIGKTAISAYISRVLKGSNLDPVVIAMGRGGPKEPDVLKGSEIKLDTGFLIKMSEQGMHAASDYYEDALMSRVTTVGCRRCGGGLAGMPFISNVREGALIANSLDGSIIIYEGSGSSIPPVKADKYILTISSSQQLDYVSGYFGPFRILISDLIILTNCEQPNADKLKIEKMRQAINKVKPGIKIIETVFRPKPLSAIDGKNIFIATTSPAFVMDKISGYLEDKYGCSVVGYSTNLSNRKLLNEDIEEFGDSADIFLTELKAAAVDVVAKKGVEKGKEIVFYDNEPITSDGKLDLKKEITDIANKAITAFNN